MRTIILSIITLLTLSVFAQDDVATRQKHFNLDHGLAIDGFDPVAYFSQNKAVEGSKQWQYTYNKVTYYFSSEKNRELFKQKPDKYEPQYGGWCAYAMGDRGDKVSVDPETFKIVDGKLYLFYNRFFNNTLNDWNEDEVHLKRNADNNWQKIVK